MCLLYIKKFTLDFANFDFFSNKYFLLFINLMQFASAIGSSFSIIHPDIPIMFFASPTFVLMHGIPQDIDSIKLIGKHSDFEDNIVKSNEFIIL